MIVDMRVYTYTPAQFTGFVKAYTEVGHAIVSRHLGYMTGVFISASSTANRTLQFFAYEDNDHRDMCRQALRSDPAWLEFIRGAALAISVQENTILRPSDHSPAQDVAALKALAETTTARDRVFEMRTRAFHPGKAHAGAGTGELQLRTDAGEEVLAQFTADTGLGDRVLTFSAFRSAGERDAINTALGASPAMSAILQTVQPALVSEVRELWLPLPCSPLR